MKIIVTGSLGHVGKPLTKDLLKRGHQVTVISSKPEKKNEIEALGASAAIGSLEDVAFLSSVFAGADSVFTMVPPNFAVPDSMEYYKRIGGNYVKAFQHAGIKHAVHLSSYGAHLDKGTGFILGSHYVEEMLSKVADLSVTHLRPGSFYTNFYSFVDMIKTAGIMGANYGGDDLLVMVDPGDIALVAAEEIEKQAPGKHVRYIVSDERTINEIVPVLGAAIGKPDLKWLLFTSEQMQKGMEQNGLPPQIAANFVEMGEATHSGILRDDYEKHRPKEIGKTKLEDFAKEFAKAFK